eukprot:1055582-Amphidinium_carterae.1
MKLSTPPLFPNHDSAADSSMLCASDAALTRVPVILKRSVNPAGGLLTSCSWQMQYEERGVLLKRMLVKACASTA